MVSFKLFLTLTLLFAVVFSKVPVEHRKQLAGPPETFNDHSISTTAINPSKSSLNLVHLRKNMLGDDIAATIQIPVDTPKDFELIFGSPLSSKLDLTLIAPSGDVVEIAQYRKDSSIPYSSTGESIPVDFYKFDLATTGFYVLRITSNEELTENEKYLALTNTEADAFVIFETFDDIVIEAQLISPVASYGKKVGLKAQITVEGKSLSEEITQDIKVEKATLLVKTPKGFEKAIDMNDDGVNGDELAGDHFFSAELEIDEVGKYDFEAVFTGYLEGKPFQKTVQVDITAAAEDLDFFGTAELKVKDSVRALIDLNLDMSKVLTEESNLPNYRAYSEVYGTNKNGKMVPVCWIGSIVNINQQKVTLELNIDWLNRVHVTGPLILKNTYLVNLETETVVAKFDQPISVRNSKMWSIPEFTKLGREVNEITKEMREGVSVRKFNATSSVLVILHGYCASSNPFPTSDFSSGSIFYYQPNQENLLNDAFARNVIDFVEAQIGDNTPWSIVGHSQGGMVAAHIKNYYSTGLDAMNPSDGRLIQSLGTPWSGSSAANSASLGNIFGVGCGENYDLTTQGAEVWLSGISTDTRSNVYFYTTTYEQGKFFGDWCSLAMNAILDYPNDGTTELKRAKLTGANNMGNTEKQCHTTDMGYMAQYLDSSRNSVMNSNAARK